MSQRALFITAFIFLVVVHLVVGIYLIPSGNTSEPADSIPVAGSMPEAGALSFLLPALMLSSLKLFGADTIQDRSVKITIVAGSSLLSVFILYLILK